MNFFLHTKRPWRRISRRLASYLSTVGAVYLISAVGAVSFDGVRRLLRLLPYISTIVACFDNRCMLPLLSHLSTIAVSFDCCRIVRRLASHFSTIV